MVVITMCKKNQSLHILFSLLFAGLLLSATIANAGPPSSVPYVPWIVSSPFEPEAWFYKECKSCHYDYENLDPLTTSNPNKHHVLIGTKIKTMEDWETAGEWPYQTAPNHNTDADGFYDCLTCHLNSKNEEGRLVPAERNCLNCHVLTTVANNVPGNRHHATETAVTGQCVVCHCRMPEPHVQIMQGGPLSPCSLYLSGQSN